MPFKIINIIAHKDAKVLEFLPENINSFILPNNNSDITLLNENLDNILLTDNNTNIYEYLDRLIIESFRNMNPINFRI